MGSVGVPIDELQRAAPIVSGFLLGYIAMLPLIGRIADLRGPGAGAAAGPGRLRRRLVRHRAGLRHAQHGRRPVPAGRRRRVAWSPPRWRWSPTSTPCSAVRCRSAWCPACRSSAACSARCSARWSWPSPTGGPSSRSTSPSAWCSPRPCASAAPAGLGGARPHRGGRPDLVGSRTAAAWASPRPRSCSSSPAGCVADLTWGRLFVPVWGDGRWLTPVGLVAIGAFVLFLARCVTAAPAAARRPRLGPRDAGRPTCSGALLLATALGGRHPGLRHGRPPDRGLLRPRLVVPRRRLRGGRRVRLAPAARRSAPGAHGARSRRPRPGARCW